MRRKTSTAVEVKDHAHHVHHKLCETVIMPSDASRLHIFHFLTVLWLLLWHMIAILVKDQRRQDFRLHTFDLLKPIAPVSCETTNFLIVSSKNERCKMIKVTCDRGRNTNVKDKRQLLQSTRYTRMHTCCFFVRCFEKRKRKRLLYCKVRFVRVFRREFKYWPQIIWHVSCAVSLG